MNKISIVFNESSSIRSFQSSGSSGRCTFSKPSIARSILSRIYSSEKDILFNLCRKFKVILRAVFLALTNTFDLENPASVKCFCKIILFVFSISLKRSFQILSSISDHALNNVNKIFPIVLLPVLFSPAITVIPSIIILASLIFAKFFIFNFIQYPFPFHALTKINSSSPYRKYAGISAAS